MKQKPIACLEDFADIDVQALARAFEADAGESLPGLREALGQAKRGEAGRVTTPEQMLIREARKAAGMSQDEFARCIETPVATLRGWEQGRFAPPGTATALARLIAKHPQWVGELASASM
jgi:putative transcriptional regulator